jgi:hypothetical protein
MPRLRCPKPRGNAYGRLPVLLRLSSLRGSHSPPPWRLLCLLFLWQRSVPPEAGGAGEPPRCLGRHLELRVCRARPGCLPHRSSRMGHPRSLRSRGCRVTRSPRVTLGGRLPRRGCGMCRKRPQVRSHALLLHGSALPGALGCFRAYRRWRTLMELVVFVGLVGRRNLDRSRARVPWQAIPPDVFVTAACGATTACGLTSAAAVRPLRAVTRGLVASGIGTRSWLAGRSRGPAAERPVR